MTVAGEGSDIPGGARPDNRVLLIVAADHRGSLERGLYGLTAPPTPVQAARISADKLLVYQALLDAVQSFPPRSSRLTADRRAVRASFAELASHSAGAVSVCMPLEASGQEWFGFAYGEDWQRHAGFFAAGHAKVLVHDNPGLDPARREQHARQVAQVSVWAAAGTLTPSAAETRPRPSCTCRSEYRSTSPPVGRQQQDRHERLPGRVVHRAQRAEQQRQRHDLPHPSVPGWRARSERGRDQAQPRLGGGQHVSSGMAVDQPCIR